MVYVLSFEEQVIEVAFTKHMIYKDYTVCQRLNFSTESMLYTSNSVSQTDSIIQPNLWRALLKSTAVY